MTTDTYHLEFLTPCFCAGADQSVAEIRAPSIRGKLRWWFRVLGGTAGQEAEVFGSVHAEEGSASAVIIRVREDQCSPWQPIQFAGTSNAGYILYFAKASADSARWVPTGALPVGSRFEMLLTWRKRPSPECQSLFDLSLDCFLMLGALGLRSTRGLGAFTCAERPFSEEAFQQLLNRIKTRARGFIAGLAQFSGPEQKLLDALGAQLRGLRQGCSAKRPGPLGSSQPRQTSAVYLRPVRENTGLCKLVVFEAPPEKVLGVPARRNAPRLGGDIPSPANAPAIRTRHY